MNRFSQLMRHVCPRALTAFALALPATMAWALVTPGPCGDDAHVLCAVYDASEVYELPYHVGDTTIVQLEPGEIIDGPESGAGVGYAKPWTVGAKGNWIMFKPNPNYKVVPGVPKRDTDLVIVTNRRRYVFKLIAAARGMTPVWALSFTYPDTRARQSAEEARKSALAAAMLKGAAGRSTHTNENYDMHGDTALAPTAMWDDGRFTYFQYATSRDLPVIYRLMPDGSEAVPNSHPDGDTIVVHDTSGAFMLRLGQSVLGIRNNAYTPDGQFNRTGTTVPGTVRLSKEKDGE